MGSEFGAIWEDPEGGDIKFVIKRALKQDQTLHMEGKLHVILYIREEWAWKVGELGFLWKKSPLALLGIVLEDSLLCLLRKTMGYTCYRNNCNL